MFGMVVGQMGLARMIIELKSDGIGPNTSFDQFLEHSLPKVAPALAHTLSEITGDDFKEQTDFAVQHMGPLLAQTIANDGGALVIGIESALIDSIPK
jgi:hypothetical protein